MTWTCCAVADWCQYVTTWWVRKTSSSCHHSLKPWKRPPMTLRSNTSTLWPNITMTHVVYDRACFALGIAHIVERACFIEKELKQQMRDLLAQNLALSEPLSATRLVSAIFLARHLANQVRWCDCMILRYTDTSTLTSVTGPSWHDQYLGWLHAHRYWNGSVLLVCIQTLEVLQQLTVPY